jgi:hypothetical protein
MLVYLSHVPGMSHQLHPPSFDYLSNVLKTESNEGLNYVVSMYFLVSSSSYIGIFPSAVCSETPLFQTMFLPPKRHLARRNSMVSCSLWREGTSPTQSPALEDYFSAADSINRLRNVDK